MSGFSLALLVASFLLGLRHGIDWDHIAAIADITSSQESPRRALWYSTLYALGHGSVVIIIGAALILSGLALPDSVEMVMERVVGATLIFLGIWVVVSLARRGSEFQLRSRWMLLFAGFRRLSRRVRSRFGKTPGPVASDDLVSEYGVRTSLGIGALHGIGAETPTQVLIFLAAAGAGGRSVGLATLVVFVAGIITMNTFLALGAAFGMVNAARSKVVNMTAGVVVAVFSLVIGTVFLFGLGDVLPALS
jgi:high-affinity nickel-transport protein